MLLLLQSGQQDTGNINKLPAALTRRYDVYVHPEVAIPVVSSDGHPSKRVVQHPILKMRAVNSKHIGQLVRVKVGVLALMYGGIRRHHACSCQLAEAPEQESAGCLCQTSMALRTHGVMLVHGLSSTMHAASLHTIHA